MTDDVRAIAQRMYAAFNTRDFSATERILSPDFVSHALGTTGPAKIAEAWSRLHAAYPDAQVVVEDMLVEGDRAAVRTTVRGIPTGAAGGQPPMILEIFRVQDGRIAELWGLTTLGRPG